MMDLPPRSTIRILAGAGLAAAMLVVLVPLRLDDPEQALQSAVAGALARNGDDRLLEAALEQYPQSAPAIAITYGHLPLFQEQLARFGPQVVPIVAAYQDALTTADAVQLARQLLESARKRLTGDPRAFDLTPLTAEERGLIALLSMRQEGNAFVGQWEIDERGQAKRVPSRMITLAGPEILIGGLTALERNIVQGKAIDWQTYGLAAIDTAAITSGVALLRFARTVGRGTTATRAVAGAPTLGSGALRAAKVLGIKAARWGAPVGLIMLLLWYPGVVTHYLWILAEGLGLPGILGPIIGWGIVLVPLSFLLSWMLLSARALRFAGRMIAGAAHGCQHLARRLAAADARRA